MIDLENLRDYTLAAPKGWTAFGNVDDFNALPGTHKEQLLFLDKTATEYLLGFSGSSANLLTGANWEPFAKGNFRTVEECNDLQGTEESNAALKKWLFGRGIPFKAWVFVLFEDYDSAMLMTWKMLVKYADLLFLRNDVMVFDSTLNWCLFYFHENRLLFGRDSQYDSTENDALMQSLNERKKKFPSFRHPYL